MIYVRVSSVGTRDRDSASYQTEDEQRAKGEAYATKHDIDVVGVYSDIDVSGARFDRDGLGQVMELADAGAIDAVIVYDVSRLGRNLRGILEAVDQLSAKGVALLSTYENVDRSTTDGELHFGMVALIAQHQRSRLADHLEASKANARRRGVLVGPTPFGYQRSADATLEPHPAEAQVVVDMYAARAAGETFAQLAARMDAVKLTRTGRPRSATAASKLIRNPIYRGELPGGAAGPPLVTDDAWYAAQGDGPVRRRSMNHDFLLRGIATCGTCGGPMVGSAYGGVTSSVPVYVCRARSRPEPERCASGPVITAARLEPWVIGHVEALAARVEVGETVDSSALVRRAEEVAAQAERDVRSWMQDARTRDLVGEAAWYDELEQRIATRDAAKTAEASALAERASGAALTWREAQADGEALAAYLRSAIVHLRVSRGRGPVDERCDLRLWR